MNPIVIFWIVFLVLLTVILFLAIKHKLLNDESVLTAKKPYSFSRSQIAWWTLVILSSYITVFLVSPGHVLPDLKTHNLILLGITTGTLAAARLSDISTMKNPDIPQSSLSQNQDSQSFLLDILSDKTGVSIHRLQALIFNLAIGGWMICRVLHNLGVAIYDIPDISEANVALLAISSGAYVALKTTENKV